MILTMNVLNSDATLNNFSVIGSAKFVPNQPLKIVLQLMQTERKLRYIPSAAATITLNFKKSTGPDLAKVATFLDAGDRSLIVVELTATESENLISQNLTGSLVDGSINAFISLDKALQNANVNNC